LVAYIAVDKRARQQGLAKRLMQEAFKNLWEANGYRIPKAVFAEAEYLPDRHDSLQSDRLVSLNRMGGYLVPLGNLYRQPALSPDAQLGENLVLLAFDIRKVLPTNDTTQFQFPDRELVKRFLEDYFKCHEQFNQQLNSPQTAPTAVRDLLSLHINKTEHDDVITALQSHYGIQPITEKGSGAFLAL
jgi:GNAT superfamily N-acetyltransferase